MAIDREGLRDAVTDKLLAEPALADELQIDKFEGEAESESGREDWFDQFLTAKKGAIAVSYAGSQERDGQNGRTQEAIITLLHYARYEATALRYLYEMEQLLDGEKIVTGGKGYWTYWAADQMTGKREGYYEYEVQLRIETD